MDKLPAVTLLHFSQTSQAVTVGQVLERMEFSVTRCDACECLDSGRLTDCDVFAVFCDAWRAEFEKTITCFKDTGTPLLCIETENSPSCREPSNLFSDTVKWPCSYEELTQSINHLAALPAPLPLLLPCAGSVQELHSLNVFGQSEAFLQVVRLIKSFSGCRATILIEGETGTGKELAARALHYLSPHSDKPFIPINCGAYPDELFENELFGHERGAFTDARNAQPGLIAKAEGGTLFLDEVDSLSQKTQVSLLRFLQDQQYRPLGGSKLIQGKISIIAATNLQLEEAVEQGGFREDLFYRLNVVRLKMPSLRDRQEDIGLLARYFVRRLSHLYEVKPKVLHPDSLDWLASQQWPGNIRELENLIHREFLLSDASIIRIKGKNCCGSKTDPPTVKLTDSSFKCSYKEARQNIVDEFEKQYLHQLMLRAAGNVSLAARMAKRERRSFGRLLRKNGIDRGDYLADSHALRKSTTQIVSDKRIKS